LHTLGSFTLLGLPLGLSTPRFRFRLKALLLFSPLLGLPLLNHVLKLIPSSDFLAPSRPDCDLFLR